MEEKIEGKKDLSEVEMEILLEENPELLNSLRELFLKEKLVDPRVPKDKKPPYIHHSIHICGFCEDVKHEFTKMRYVERLSSFIRERSATEEEISTLREEIFISVSSLIHCSNCLSRLEYKSKLELIKLLIQTPLEREVRERKLKEAFLSVKKTN